MGKTKIKTIDDSIPIEEKKKSPKKRVEKIEEKAVKSELVKSTDEESQTKSEDDSKVKPIKSEEKAEIEVSKIKKTQKPGKAKPRSKKYQETVKDLDRSKTYPLAEAVDMVKKLNYAKFNATLEAHINTVASGIRGLVSLPYASAKLLRILVFGRLPSPEEYEGVIFGDDSTIEEINKGKVNFDLVITTPEWMPKIAKIARILGPRGLMPNPKNGTITKDLKKAVAGFQTGKTEYKTESKAAVIHLGLGKLDQPTEELSANIKTLLQTLGKTKVKKVSLSPTMGPSVKVDLASI